MDTYSQTMDQTNPLIVGSQICCDAIIQNHFDFLVVKNEPVLPTYLPTVRCCADYRLVIWLPKKIQCKYLSR